MPCSQCEGTHAVGLSVASGRREPIQVGLFRALLPQACGGVEVPLPEVQDTMEERVAADGVTGWCAMVDAGFNTYIDNGTVLPGSTPDLTAVNLMMAPVVLSPPMRIRQ